MQTLSENVHYWTSNQYIIGDPTVNITFHELLLMSDLEVTNWINHMRKRVLEVWDKYGLPPLSGKTEREMEEVFREMSGTRGKKIMTKNSSSNEPFVDELTGESNVIINDGNLGSCVNQFFPTMMKAQINYQTKVDDSGSFNGYAVYDLFANDKFVNRIQKGCRRHFRRDSFYRYSQSIPEASSNSQKSPIGLKLAKTGKEWVQLFKRDFVTFKDCGYWLSRVEIPEDGDRVGSGYTSIDASKFLWLSKSEIIELYGKGIIPKEALSNLVDTSKEISWDSLKNDEQYHIRFYKNDTRIFPTGFTAFKVGYIQVAVNFPPMIAKALYEKYTEHIKEQKVINVYDPSAGWGGRIAGAMTVYDDRRIHYIGTDPNTDNFIPEIGITRYEYLANFINKSLKNFFGENNTFDIFQLGSEVIGKDSKFKKYKGKLDLVFTSPPYHAREKYSDDLTQSCSKFPIYEDWVKGFLRPTLETAVNFLRKDRYLLWNIADVKVGDSYQPLEKDSSDILKSLNMKFIGIEKMALQNMPGANRIKEDGTPSAKNFMRVNGQWRKYEPVFIWYKQ